MREPSLRILISSTGPMRSDRRLRGPLQTVCILHPTRLCRFHHPNLPGSPHHWPLHSHLHTRFFSPHFLFPTAFFYLLCLFLTFSSFHFCLPVELTMFEQRSRHTQLTQCFLSTYQVQRLILQVYSGPHLHQESPPIPTL